MKLLLGGGSYKGLITLGVMHYLYKCNKLKNIDLFSGCSIGAVIGIFLIMGIEPIEMYNELISVEFSNYTKLDVSSLLTDFTLVGSKFFDLWKSIFLKYENDCISIKEFNKKYSCNINIASTCVNTRQTVIFNETDHPDVKVFDAILASCSIPFIFPPHKINGLYYVDGGCKCYFDKFNADIDEDTIIVKLPSIEFSEESMTNFSGYMKEIICTLTYYSDLKMNNLTLTLDIPEKYVNNHDFSNITNDDKTELFLSGITQARSFYRGKL
tara:strand:+ start:406 stop:1212 length:807 start_codon:yes stop_codon:yes gene_type:complete